MKTVRGLVVAALSTVAMTLGLLGLLAIPTDQTASATSQQWVTTASYQPLPNVKAVSCAPSSSTCVAVGDDGGNFASILVSNDGGSTWTDVITVPTGSDQSCRPSPVLHAVDLLRRRRLRNLEIRQWWIELGRCKIAAFPCASISCFTSDECTAVAGLRRSYRPPTDRPGRRKPSQRHRFCSSSVSCPNQAHLRRHWSRRCQARPLSEPKTADRGLLHTDANSALASLTSLSRAVLNNCVAVGELAWRRTQPSISTTDFTDLE